MKRTMKFTKMHGAGNDFVMLDSRDLQDIDLNPHLIAFLCDRRKGIGGDGLIVIDKPASDQTDFRMIYFNADGQEAEMCGNGARCSVAFAHEAGLIPRECKFDTFSGVLEGTVLGPGDIQVSLPVWQNLEMDRDLGPADFDQFHTCNTGVPHLVIPVPDVQLVDVIKWGGHYRHHDDFAPAGTNVNFTSRDPASGEFFLRTYERGVEDETLACGTGASATAVVLCKLGLAESPVSLHTQGGDVLRISVDFSLRKLLLRGPAETSHKGEVLINER
jgi:diaminopimelate epimerase